VKIDPVELREFAARYTAAWCSREANRVAAFYSTDGSLGVNGDAPAMGRDAIAQLAQSFMTAFPDLHLNMDTLVMREEGAEYHWTLTGTNTGPGGTGNQVRISGFERWRIGADGLIAVSLGQFDNADYRRQLEFGAAGTG
jgi:ketosteroid isomerase-like protein